MAIAFPFLPIEALGHGPLISEHCHISQRETAGSPPDRAREQEYNREVTPFQFSQRETAGSPPNRAREQEYNREVTPFQFSQRGTAGSPPNRTREQEYNREMTLFPILLVRDSWSTAQPYQRAER
jgi:hypothetical protein